MAGVYKFVERDRITIAANKQLLEERTYRFEAIESQQRVLASTQKLLRQQLNSVSKLETDGNHENKKMLTRVLQLLDDMDARITGLQKQVRACEPNL